MKRNLRWSRRHALANGAAGAAALVTFAACGTSGEVPAGGAKSAPPATVRVADRVGSEEEVYGKRIPAFEAAHPTIKVEYELSGEWGAPKVTTLAAAGALPDLMHLLTNTQDYHHFFLQGVALEADSYVKRDKLDLKQYYPDAVKCLQVDGKIGGLPFHGYMARVAVMYNNELFKRAGVPVPGPTWTYDDLATLLPKLARIAADDPAASAMGIGWSELTTMISVFRAWGGDVFSQDGKKSTLTAPPAGNALRWHLDRFLREKTLVLANPKADPQALFMQGKLALWGRNNPGAAGALVPLRGQLDWGMTLMPKGPAGRRGAMLQASSLSMSRDAKARDQAWPLQQWLTDKETGVQFALASKGSLTPGARPDVYADARFLGRADLPPGVQETARKAMDEPEPFGLAWNYRGGEVDKVVRDDMGKLLSAEATPEPGFLQDLDRRIQAILDQPRA